MSDPNSEGARQARNAIQRVVEVARQGQARLSSYRQESAVLGTWLRSHLFRQGGKGQQVKSGRQLQSAVTTRRLRQRQEVHRKEVHRNGGGRSSTAVYCLKRAAQAIGRKKNR